MKKSIPVIFLSVILISCSENDPDLDETSIHGKWLLVEQLADPGDGSGTFQPVDSDNTIEFFADGKFRSNFILCSMGTNSGQSGQGTFSITENLIFPADCPWAEDRGLSFEWEDVTLKIYYPCIEPCAQKFKKISDHDRPTD